MKLRVVQAMRASATAAAAAKLRAVAALRGTRCHIRIDSTASLSPAAIFEVDGPGEVWLSIGPRSFVEAGAQIVLSPGATVVIGADCRLRRGSVLNVSGSLEMVGRNLLSWHSVVHCANDVRFEEMAGTGEGVTVVDGAHTRQDPDDHWYHNATTAPVVIGRNVWLASKATVTKGVTIGPATTVGANSVVTTDLPSECFAAGVPARVVRQHVFDRGVTRD